MNQCNFCNMPLSESDTACPACASPVGGKRCPQCAQVVAADASFCLACGEQIGAIPQAEAPAPVQAPPPVTIQEAQEIQEQQTNEILGTTSELEQTHQRLRQLIQPEPLPMTVEEVQAQGLGMSDAQEQEMLQELEEMERAAEQAKAAAEVPQQSSWASYGGSAPISATPNSYANSTPVPQPVTYGAVVANSNPNKTKALISMIAGIVAFLATGVCCGLSFLGISPIAGAILGFLGGAAAVVLGILSIKGGEPGKGMAIAGLITGGLALLFGVPATMCMCSGCAACAACVTCMEGFANIET